MIATYELTDGIAEKVLQTVDAGLVKGLGSARPGAMCVEAAVCFALGLPHGDNPPCVGLAVRSFKIALNDSDWSSDKARGEGMRRIALAQLGSDVLDQAEFLKLLSEQVIRQIVPKALRSAAATNPEFVDSFEAAAIRCSEEGTEGAAIYAAYAAYAAANAAANAANAANYATTNAANAAADAAYAADAANYATTNAAANATTNAAANAAANAANAANAAADAANAYDELFGLLAEIGVQVLISMGSPGCKWLHLTEREDS